MHILNPTVKPVSWNKQNFAQRASFHTYGLAVANKFSTSAIYSKWETMTINKDKDRVYVSYWINTSFLPAEDFFHKYFNIQFWIIKSLHNVAASKQ